MADYKILLLSPSLEDIGGVSFFCKLLIKNLDSKFKIDYVQIGNIPGNKSLLKQFIFFLKNTLALRKKLIENDYHVIHINPSLTILSFLRDSFYLLIINKFYSENSLVLFHGWSENLANKMLKIFICNWLFRKIYKKVKVILVLCSQFKEQLVKMGIASEKVEVITTMYQFNGDIQQFQKYRFDNKINILFMSRFLREKGVYITAKVARSLLENGHKNFKFEFVGDGPEYKGLKDYIARFKLNDYTEVPGYVTGRKKWDILKNSDIFLFPTYYEEGCPVVILEAMGAGLAIISTPVAAIPDIVKHGENGFIVDSRDPKDFYEAVKRLIENNELLNKIQKINKRKAEMNYEAKVITKKIESVYLTIINSQ